MKTLIVLLLGVVVPFAFAQESTIDDIVYSAYIGNARAQAILGKHYEYGYRVDKSSDTLAQEQYRASAEAYDPLGLAYDGYFAECERGDYTKVPMIDWARQGKRGSAQELYQMALDNGLFELAQNNDAYAQDVYGYLLMYGHGGLSKQSEEGLEWREKAADAGNPFAQYEVGLIYLHEVDIKDEGKALKYFRMAAEQDFPRAQDYIAYLSWDEAAAQARTNARRGNMFIFKDLYLGMPINDACQTLNKQLGMVLGVRKDKAGRESITLWSNGGIKDIEVVADTSGNVSYFYFTSSIVDDLFDSRNMQMDEFVQAFVSAASLEGSPPPGENQSYWEYHSPKGYHLKIAGDKRMWIQKEQAGARLESHL